MRVLIRIDSHTNDRFSARSVAPQRDCLQRSNYNAERTSASCYADAYLGGRSSFLTLPKKLCASRFDLRARTNVGHCSSPRGTNANSVFIELASS